MSRKQQPTSIRFVALLAVVAQDGVAVLAGVAVLGRPAHGAAKPVAAVSSMLTADEAIKVVTGANGTLTFDVAENGTVFAWSGDPELKDGLPIARTSFISQGRISNGLPRSAIAAELICSRDSNADRSA